MFGLLFENGQSRESRNKSSLCGKAKTKRWEANSAFHPSGVGK